MDHDDAVERLYSGSPEDFLATRAELVRAARAAKDRDLATRIAALRRPAVPAAALNEWVRRDPDALAALLDLGERLRDAQARLDGPALAALRREREALLARLVADAGEGLGATASAQVRATLVAALADEQAAAAVASGALVRPLEYTGFGEVVLDDAVAARRLRLVPAPGRPADAAGVGRGENGPEPVGPGVPDAAEVAAEAHRARATEQARATERARAVEHLDATRRAAEEAGAALAAADAERGRREHEHAEARQALAVLEEQLDLARRRVAATAARSDEARRHAEQARRAHDAATNEADRARAAVTALDR